MQKNSPVRNYAEQDGYKKMAPRKKAGKKKYTFLKVLILILICMIVFMTCALFGYRYIVEGTSQANDVSDGANAVVFKIPSGSSASAIANKLKAEGFITNTRLYTILSKVMGFDNAYKAGNFLIGKDMNYYALMVRLSSDPIKNPTKDVMIPEGKTLLETAQLLSGQGYVDQGKFLKISKKESEQYTFLKNIKATDVRKYPLEGYLYPDTYKMDEGWTEEELIDRMLKEFDRIFTKEYYDRAEELGMTVDQVVTMASIIEMEARYPTDLKKISSVLHNRLKSKDLKVLQSDATVQYARVYQGLGRTTSVLYKDLEIDSPYNTYKNAGLPPGPICSPRKDSIEAALYPENTKYLYFFATPDGKNIYNETFKGHINDQKKYGVSGQTQ